jgi:hypothetical protein
MQSAVPLAVSRVALNFQVILNCRALDFRLHAVSITLGCKPLICVVIPASISRRQTRRGKEWRN